MKLGQINRISIMKPSSLGDIIHSLPTLVALRKLYPESHISWIVFPRFAEILVDNPYLNEIIVWKKNISIPELMNFIKFVRNKNFDLVIDLQGLARTGLLSFLSGAKYRLGCPGMRELSYLFCKEVARYSTRLHAVDRNLKVIEYLGGEIDTKLFPIHISDEDKIYAKIFLQDNGYDFKRKLIGISPAVAVWQKMWPPENYAVLSDKIIDDLKGEIIFFGIEKDSPVVNRIMSIMKNKSNVINAVGKTTLKQLCALIKHCSLFIGNDTGPLHIAAALDVLPIAFYGPSNPVQLAPYHKDAVVFWKKLDCSPCGIRPGCKNNSCMEQITPEEVYEKVKNSSYRT